MTDLVLIQQTEQSLAAIKTFASQNNNEPLLELMQRLEVTLGALATGDSIAVGNISFSTVVIGRDINIINNQVLPPSVKQPLENVQKQWTARHLGVQQVMERSRGGHVFLSYTRADTPSPCASPASQPHSCGHPAVSKTTDTKTAR